MTVEVNLKSGFWYVDMNRFLWNIQVRYYLVQLCLVSLGKISCLLHG